MKSNDDTDSSSLKSSLLKWSETQSHILTGGGVSSRWYRAPRFPFFDDELPHFHKARGTTHEAFATWRREGTALGREIAGAWRRPLFVGGWTHSVDDRSDTAASPLSTPQASPKKGETTFNLQTPSFFIDIRVPNAGSSLLRHHQGFHTMTDEELRLFARRHAFAGYTRHEPVVFPAAAFEPRGDGSISCLSGGGGGGGSVATRHHCIDWNYVGEPRPRPNKWRVEVGPGGDVWREWGFAKDAFEQHIYMERWERLSGGRGPYFAIRRRPSSAPDALLVVCGDHFGLIVDRAPPPSSTLRVGDGGGSLVGSVDDAIARGDRRKAVALLSLEASHGRVSAQRNGSAPWTVDCSLHPWLENRRPFVGSILTVARDGLSVVWNSSGGVPRQHSRWNGAALDGVWDVVENTTMIMVLPPSSHRRPSAPGGGGGGVPPLAFEAVLAGSGAKVLTAGEGIGVGAALDRRGGGEGVYIQQAKL